MKQPTRLLLVEDDAAVMLALQTRLRTLGFNVLPTADGITATSVAAVFEPEILLLDINLPLRDGFKTAESIQEAVGRSIPTIFITASRSPQLRRTAEHSGASFLEKPFTASFLAMKLNDALDQPLATP